MEKQEEEGLGREIAIYVVDREFFTNYNIKLSMWLFAIPIMLVFGVGLLTTAFHKVKSAYANPVNSLKNE